MEGTSNWRPVQSGDPAMNGEVSSADWRLQLQPEARPRIVNKIMDTLKKHLPISGPEGLGELRKIAVRFEEKIYTAATSQSDYLRKISMKMLTMEQKTQGTIGANQLSTNANAAGQNPADQVNMLSSQVRNQGLSMPVPVGNQPPSRLLPQNLQNNIASAPMSGAGGLSTALSSLTGLTPSSMSTLGQNQNMQVMPGISQNSISNTPGQSVQQNMYATSQRQMQGRHHQQSMLSQQQQQPQNQLLYQQQLIKHKIHQSPILQSQIQQQQQTLLQSTQLQSSQQPLIQMSSGLQSNQNSVQHSQSPMIHSVSQSGLQQSQQNSSQQSTSSSHQQHAQSLVRQQSQPPQQSNLHQQNTLVQQPTSITQQSSVLSSQTQQIMGHQSNMSSIQQSQLLGQQNSISDMQQQPLLQQHQRLPSQQNGLMSMQQSQQMLNQQNFSLQQQQQPTSQSKISGLQQQQSLQQAHQPQMIVSQAAMSNMQQQHSMHILQHPKGGGQQIQHTSPALLQLQGQQTQAHASQQQHISQPQSQHLQQQIGMQQQQQLQQRLQGSSALLQPQNAVEQQKQNFQSSRVTLPEMPSSSVDSTAQTGQAGLDWQEECYQKIKSMRESYSVDLQDMSQKIGIKLQQEALGISTKTSEYVDNIKRLKARMDHILQLFHLPKNNIQPGLKEKLPNYEKQIQNLLANKRRNGPSQAQGHQQVHPGGQNLPVPQPASQLTQPQADDHIKPTQSTNFTASSAPMHPTAMSNMPTQSGVSTMQHNMSSLPHSSNLESTSGLSSMQQGGVSSRQNGGIVPSQQISVNATHQNNINSMVQNTVSSLQLNANSLQANPNLLQQVKPEQQQQMMTAQHLKRLQQQMLHHQQQKQQPSSQLHGMQHQSIKPGLFQPHYSTGQRQSYYQQQLKLPPSFPISSSQNLQVPSPQLSQHSSPQIDLQVLSSVSKSGTPLQSVNSPFVVPSPSTPLAPSPLPVDNEKHPSGIAPLSNAGNAVPQQSTLAPAQAQSLAVGTPGISASPLLADFGVDGNQANATAIIPGKPTAIERPLDRLIKVVRSSSPHVLTSSANDIGSVVSMIDRIAGSAPGSGSRAAVGEDLVAMTKCRMQARNFMQQDGATTKKMKRHTSAMPLNAVSSAGSVDDCMKQSSIDTSELESTATSRVKRQKMEANHILLEEIRFINQQLIDTIVDVTDEEDVDSINATAEGEGTIVKCTYSAVALSPSLKSQFASARVSPILPLRLLVPANYPYRSPVLLDKISIETSKESEDLSVKAKSRFSISLRGLSQPMSLKEMARTWDVCARKVISEYAQQGGGGTFSSRYGTWENCLSA